MELLVYSMPDETRQATEFASGLGARPHTVSIRKRIPKLQRVSKCLMYLAGDESLSDLGARLKELTRSRMTKVVLYTLNPDPGRAAELGRMVERIIADRGTICFDRMQVARALKLSVEIMEEATGTAPGAEVEELRRKLALTQEEVGQSIGVSDRTVQNWEAGRPSPRIKQRLRDLSDLLAILEAYIQLDQIPVWLRAPNDAFRGDPPIQWILDGRTRDVLIEFRRLQTGEPL